MKKPQSNPYIGKLEPIMTKYLNGRFGPWEGVRRWERTVETAQKFWDETPYIAWRFTSCPLAEFARAHDLLPWAAYLCQMDHAMAEAAGCRLLREHTLVKGDEECDYWIVGSKTAEEIQKKG